MASEATRARRARSRAPAPRCSTAGCCRSSSGCRAAPQTAPSSAASAETALACWRSVRRRARGEAQSRRPSPTTTSSTGAPAARAAPFPRQTRLALGRQRRRRRQCWWTSTGARELRGQTGSEPRTGTCRRGPSSRTRPSCTAAGPLHEPPRRRRWLAIRAWQTGCRSASDRSWGGWPCCCCWRAAAPPAGPRRACSTSRWLWTGFGGASSGTGRVFDRVRA